MIDVIEYTRFWNYPLVSTTDATPTAIATVEIADSLAGMLIIDVVSIETDGTGTNVGRYAVKYSKIATMTLGTLTTIYEDNDSAVSIGVLANGDENIEVQGTGVAATDINWLVRTQILDQQFTDLP